MPEDLGRTGGDQSAAGAAGADGAAAVGGETGAGAQPTARPWYERRIDEVTGNWRQTQRDLEAANARAQIAEGALELAKKGGAVVPPPAAGTQEFNEAVNRTAAQRADIIAFDSRCNRIAAEGSERYADFDASVATFKRLGELTRPIIEAADETGHAADLIYELGKNPEEAARILKLTPIQQIAAVVKFARKYEVAAVAGGTVARAGDVSSAPAPIRTVVGGRAAADKPSLYDTDKLSTEEWIAQREADIAERRKRA